MDPLQRGYETGYASDLPLPLTDDPLGQHTYMDVFPENVGAQLNERNLTESQPKLHGLPSALENKEQRCKKEPPPVPSRPPPLRNRLPSACLEHRHHNPPPPVPPRPRQDFRNSKQFSFDLPEHAHRLNRSRTETDNAPWAVTLIDTPEGSTKNLAAFCAAASKLNSRYKHTDGVHNSGVVWARVLHIHPALLQQVEVNVSVAREWDHHQLPFPTSVNRTVRSLIDEIFQLLDIDPGTSANYVLKLCDSDEYLQNEELLGMHEIIQRAHKLNLGVPLRLLHLNNLKYRLLRDGEDDRTPCQLYEHLRPPDCVHNTCKLSLQDVLSNYSREVTELMRSKSGMNTNVLVGWVRTMSNLLCGLSCPELEDAIGRLNRINPIPLVDITHTGAASSAK